VNEYQRDRASAVAAGIAGSCLTDEQMKLLAQRWGSMGSDRIEQDLRENSCNESRRGGILLPWLVGGQLEDFPLRATEIAAILITLYSVGGDAGKAVQRLLRMAGSAALGNHNAINVGSEAFYDSRAEQGPAALHAGCASVSAAALFAAQGLKAKDLGTGFDGNVVLKGALPATNQAGVGSAQAPRSVTRDAALSAASSQADDIVEKTK